MSETWKTAQVLNRMGERLEICPVIYQPKEIGQLIKDMYGDLPYDPTVLPSYAMYVLGRREKIVITIISWYLKNINQKLPQILLSTYLSVAMFSINGIKYSSLLPSGRNGNNQKNTGEIDSPD